MMRTRQYCYFALKSDTLSAVEMAARLQMDPDEVMVVGSRSAEHRIPCCHAWKIIRRSTESVDDQIAHLIDRLNPVRARLVSLTSDPDVSSVLQVVRYFHDPEGVHAALGGASTDRRREGPRPLGWHLSLPALEFLSSLRTELDVDEYDFSDDNVPGE
ncbi:DUF4279 domain-containing protein [Nocardia brasiliensis]|uniref:DUF4279 domain-containing protein n=1 Tax=Nocardia brasiliensis TaxID=37326 RepID=UPI0037B72312